MDTKTPPKPSLDEMTKPQPESDDPDYVAWVNAKIKAAEAEIAAGAPLIPAEEVWKELGIDD